MPFIEIYFLASQGVDAASRNPEAATLNNVRFVRKGKEASQGGAGRNPFRKWVLESSTEAEKRTRPGTGSGIMAQHSDVHSEGTRIPSLGDFLVTAWE